MYVFEAVDVLCGMEIKQGQVFLLVECQGFDLDLRGSLIRTGEGKIAKLEKMDISCTLHCKGCRRLYYFSTEHQ